MPVVEITKAEAAITLDGPRSDRAPTFLESSRAEGAPPVVLVLSRTPLGRELVHHLYSSGYQPLLVAARLQAARVIGAELCDLVLVDATDAAPLEVLSYFSEQASAPIIVLGESDFGGRIATAALEQGAAHYWVQADGYRNLRARVRSTLNNCRRIPPPAPKVKTALWRLNLAAREVQAPGGGRVRLTEQQIRIMRCLTDRAGEIVTREEIAFALGAEAIDNTPRTIDVQIARLRRRLAGVCPRPDLVETVRRRGYVFNPSVPS